MSFYFNNAAHCRLSARVQKVGEEWLHKDPWELHAEEDQDAVRQLFAKLIDADDGGKSVAITPCTSYAITMAAHNLERIFGTEKEGKILLLQDQFSSAVYPWQEICDRSEGRLSFSVIPYPNRDLEENWTDLAMEKLNTDPTIVCACLPPLHWSDGSLLDLNVVGKVCREKSIPLIVDATQALGIYPCSVKHIQPTMMCASVHKWLRSPSGQSLVYLDPSVVDTWLPLDQHGRSRDIPGSPDWDAARNVMKPNGYPEKFVNDARKFDAGGRPSPSVLPMLRAALEEVTEIDSVAAQEKLRHLLQPLLSWVSQRVDYFDKIPIDGNQQAYHIISLRPKNASTEDMISWTKALKSKGVHVAVRCGGIRVSPYLDNTPEDVSFLIKALECTIPTMDKRT